MIHISSGTQFSNLTRFNITSSRSEDVLSQLDVMTTEICKGALLGVANQVHVRGNFVLDT